MQKDPRFLNQVFSQETIVDYLSDYGETLHRCLNSISSDQLVAAAHLMAKARQAGSRVFVAGNGGSAAITEHLGCDWQKGVHVKGHKGLKVHCLTANTSLVTAIANDYGYKETFAFQLEMSELKADDLVILVSSSGNSENIVAAALLAKQQGCKVIGMSGFSGGRLKELADVSLHVNFDNYGVVEDAHQVLMHVLAQFHDQTYRRRI